MEYLSLFQHLHSENVRYLICGGLAVNIYGIPRMTADIDILLDFEEANIERFEKAIKLVNYSSSIPISLKSMVDKNERDRLIQDKNMVVYSFFNPRAGYMSLDILIDTPLGFEVMWEQREERNQDNFQINLVSLKHLIELKEYSNRKQDQDDILLLSKLLKNG